MILFVWCRQQFPLFEVLVRFFIKRFTYPFCVIYHHCSQRLMTFEYYKDQKFYNYFRFRKIFIRRWYNDNNIGAWAILVYKKFDIVADVKCLDISCILHKRGLDFLSSFNAALFIVRAFERLSSLFQNPGLLQGAPSGGSALQHDIRNQKTGWSKTR